MRIVVPLHTRPTTPLDSTLTSGAIEDNAEATVPVHKVLHLLIRGCVAADIVTRSVRGDICVLVEVDEDAALLVVGDGGGGGVVARVGGYEGEVGLG
jgi:hypothetical protein